MKKFFYLSLLINSFSVFSSDIFGVIVNDQKKSYFYSDSATLNKGQKIYYLNENNACCNQLTIKEHKEGILTDTVIDNSKNLMENEKTYQFDIKKEIGNTDNLVFLAWSSASFLHLKNNMINIDSRLIYSLCLTSEGVLAQLEENENIIKSFYYYLGYDIEQNCTEQNKNVEDISYNDETQKILYKLIEASEKAKENNFEWIYKNLFIEYITFKKTADGSYKQLIDTEKRNIFYNWVVQSIYFLLSNIQFDEKNILIKSCYNIKPERSIISRTFGSVINYNSYCVSDVSLEDEELTINFFLKNDTITYPEQYKLYVKYKSMDNSFRFHRLEIHH